MKIRLTFNTGKQTVSEHTIEKNLGYYFGANNVAYIGLDVQGYSVLQVEATVEKMLRFFSGDEWRLYGLSAGLPGKPGS